MPNHCENDLWIRGSNENVAAVLAFIGADQTPPRFDFNAVIPYPEPYASMDAEHNAIEDAGKEAGRAAIGEWPDYNDPEYQGKRQAYLTAAHNARLPLMETYKERWKTTSDGFNSGGIEWRRAHWGTKWDAYDVARRDYDGRVCVSFQTAWGPAEPIIVELAKRFPDVTFVLEYFEQGMSFAGGFTCYSADDWYEDRLFVAGKQSSEWRTEEYRGCRGG